MFSNKNSISIKNHEYWIDRASGYSEVNREELDGDQRKRWSKLLDEEIMEHFGISPDDRRNIRILDIGAGPGFISIILAELGYSVTAADFARTMLKEAKKNAGELADRIEFRTENAMELGFADDSFDVVFSRNLTWNLPDPQKAYGEWMRVLKNGGMMLVFDANWYAYLRDEDKKAQYEQDRVNVKEKGFGDYNIGDNFDVMEHIAEKLPLTGIDRPAWDVDYFRKNRVKSVTSIEDIGSRVYTEKELVNYASTPMFMVKVVL
ncbi:MULTISPECIES: class I SAM-dependent methyltransferase [unclassified Butyrivibrio]|jgi:ubiquinone/menaquinone biosynthesis C-methylase UbiE|uniref:class I SAM-dependent methyltransferase n=1 Tax=unclassified Butyrivibrio TaxID=2639466 RepID=UPI000685F4B5|nr:MULTISPECIES: class I SAM-dependent methyltransferase [unclassified Butyrivibrio]